MGSVGKAVVVSLIKEKLRRAPIKYTVVFCHDAEGMKFTVYDIQDTKKDRLAVATDFAAAANILKEGENAQNNA